MIFWILLFININSCQQQGFMVIGLGTNMSIIYGSENICNYDSCPKIICDILGNTTSAYMALYPLGKLLSCPKLSSIFSVNMITFILEKNKQILFPFACNTMGDCLMKSCNLYLSSKESYLMAFTGQCL